MPSLTLEEEIDPKTQLHAMIIEEVRRRVRFSERSFSTQRLAWRKAEDEIIAYIPESAADGKRRNERENSGVPKYTTIKVPYTYAVVMALHTYICQVFLSRSPIFQFDGRHGEGQQQVLALEAYLDYQVKVGRMLPGLYSWLYDAAKYGVGIIDLYWTEQIRRVTEIQFTADPMTGIESREQVTMELPGYKGNQITNTSPRDWLPDPRVTMREFQQGEYCGSRIKLSWLEVKNRERNGYYTNVKHLDRNISPRFTDERDDDSQVIRPDDEMVEFSASRTSDSSLRHPDIVPAYQMFIELIPSMWGLSDSDYPEKWVFTVSADWKVVLGAQPHGAYHCEFPYHFIELEPDAYALSNRGMPEILKGVQDTLDWLLNSHMYNVRASNNNLFMVDPMRIVMKDLTHPVPGGAIRMRPGSSAMQGEPLKQLQIQDITRNNMGDFVQMIGVGERTSGINDQMLGAFTKTGRRTATEVRTSSVGGVSRQKVTAEYMSCVGFDTLAKQMVQNSQQYMDVELTLKIVGNLSQLAGTQWMEVTPDMIMGFFDFVPVDGTLPIDRFAQANLWKEIMMGVAQTPQLAVEYSLARIFAWTAQLAGLRNIDRFRIELGSPEHLAAQAQLGNVIPINGSGAVGGSGGGGKKRGGRNPASIQGTGDMGPIALGA